MVDSLLFLRLLNVGLRGITLLSKFFLIFFLAKFLEPSEVALYGLVVATVAYSLYGMGFDFYSYSTRELLGNSKERWAGLLRDQGVFFGMVYIFVVPLLFLIFFYELLPWFIAPWFFVIVVLEHMAQELNRLLVAMSRQLLASMVIFLRSGLWALVVVVVFLFSEGTHSINLVMTAWALGSASACLLGTSSLIKLDRRSLSDSIDWVWIKRGVSVALPLLVATLAIRGVFTVDRYWVQSLAGEEVLASYVLYFGVANAIVSFLDSGVFVFLYPKMITASRALDRQGFEKGMKQLLAQTVVVVIFLAGFAVLLIHPLLDWLGRASYSENIPLLYLLLVAIGIYSLSMVPHYGMYALSFDRHIIVSHILALPCFMGLVFFLSRWSAFYAVPLALCGAFGFVLAYKTVAYQVVKRQKKWGSAERFTPA